MPVTKNTTTSERTRSVARCGLCVAVMIVSAWVTVPLGSVPFTLQVFAMVFAVLALPPKEAVASIAIYLVMGAIGLPVFSSMRGGIGVLAGPTGGFLWGWLLASALVTVFAMLVDWKSGECSGIGALERSSGGRSVAVDAASGIVLVVVGYVCGWLQLMAVAHLGPLAAFTTAIAPFVVFDIAKTAAAVGVARAVRRAARF